MEKSRLFTENFSRAYIKLDKSLKLVIDKMINKILNKPELGKPLKHNLHGLRSERRGSVRLIYEIKNDIIIFHILKHRKKVYR